MYFYDLFINRNYRVIVHGVRSDKIRTMASFQLRPPAAFQFSKPAEWKKWKSRFEQFRLASELSEASDERQVSNLL